jgi:hypothetical protein
MSENSSTPDPDEDATQRFPRPNRTEGEPNAGLDQTAPYAPLDDATEARHDPDATQVVNAWTGRAEVRGPIPPDDGEEWTEQGPDEPGRRWWMPIFLGLLGLLVVIAAIVAATLLSRNNDNQPVPTTPATPSAAPTPRSTSPSAPQTNAPPSSAPPTATTVVVPETFGDSEAVARGKLEAIGLVVHVMTQEDPVAKPGTVLATTPPAGSEVLSGSDITVIVARAMASTSPEPKPSPSRHVPEESKSPAAAATAN